MKWISDTDSELSDVEIRNLYGPRSTSESIDDSVDINRLGVRQIIVDKGQMVPSIDDDASGTRQGVVPKTHSSLICSKGDVKTPIGSERFALTSNSSVTGGRDQRVRIDPSFQGKTGERKIQIARGIEHQRLIERLIEIQSGASASDTRRDEGQIIDRCSIVEHFLVVERLIERPTDVQDGFRAKGALIQRVENVQKSNGDVRLRLNSIEHRVVEKELTGRIDGKIVPCFDQTVGGDSSAETIIPLQIRD